MRRTRLLTLASVIAPMTLFAGCTLGLGDYPVHSDAPGALGADEDGSTTPNTEGGAEVDGDAPTTPSEGGPASGPCTESSQPRACNVPDGDAGDAGVCNGEQTCTLGTWGPCVVNRKCPATWPDGTALECRKNDVVGDSPTPWTQSPAASGDSVLWAVDRATSFDTYGQNDQFCFIPKQSGNCFTTTAVAIEVICTSGQLKLTGDNFENGNIHNKRYCVDRSGPHCAVIDKAHLVWTSGATDCVRSFVSNAFTVAAAPKCSSW